MVEWTGALVSAGHNTTLGHTPEAMDCLLYRTGLCVDTVQRSHKSIALFDCIRSFMYYYLSNECIESKSYTIPIYIGLNHSMKN